MNDDQFGTLREVDLREAWKDEALNFTPWLAAHLDRLSEVIGVELTAPETEVPVTRFSADILAQNGADGTMVLIENQLEMSDHRHLGQIMTYLAGLDAETIVWVARDFRDAHLSAVNWLNENTTSRFAFFAVKVRAVQIADSPIAPIFEVVVKPNEWERTLKRVARNNPNTAELFDFRRTFWEAFVERHPASNEDTSAGSNSNRWRKVANPDLRISYGIGMNEVFVFLRGGWGVDRHAVHALLAAHQAQLDERLQGTLREPTAAHHYVTRQPADLTDTAQWEQWIDWLAQTVTQYETTLRELGI